MDLQELNQKIQEIKDIKHKQSHYELNETTIKPDPFEQFVDWFGEALLSPKLYDPCAMVLATVDENGLPDSRVVLLKELENNRFIFYSSYTSKKAQQLNKNNVAALNFYWPYYGRQVRMIGKVEKLARHKSEAYFSSRPREAQLSAQAWMQSSILANKNEMDEKIKLVAGKFSDQEVPCPDYWGGYVVVPFEYEFFQSGKWRRHDRLLYTLEQGVWKFVRLAP